MSTALVRLQTRRAELIAQLDAAKQFLGGFDAAIALLDDDTAGECPPRAVNRRKALPAPSAPQSKRKPGRPRQATVQEAPAEKKRGVINRAELETMWAQNTPVPELAAHFGVTESAIYMAKKNWGLPARALQRQNGAAAA